MAERDEHQQSSGCSACDQLGQTPTPEHLAGVARFDARQQAARNAESLEAENARLRERVAALEAALALADETARLTAWGITVSDCREACEHPACLILRAIARYQRSRAALAGQEPAGEAS